MPYASTNTDLVFPNDELLQWCLLGDTRAVKLRNYLRRPNGIDLCGNGWTVAELQKQCKLHSSLLSRHRVLVVIGHEDVLEDFVLDDLHDRVWSLFDHLLKIVSFLVVSPIAPDPYMELIQLSKLAVINKFILSYPTFLPTSEGAHIACLNTFSFFYDSYSDLNNSIFVDSPLREAAAPQSLSWTTTTLHEISTIFRRLVGQLPWRLSPDSDSEDSLDSVSEDSLDCDSEDSDVVELAPSLQEKKIPVINLVTPKKTHRVTTNGGDAISPPRTP